MKALGLIPIRILKDSGVLFGINFIDETSGTETILGNCVVKFIIGSSLVLWVNVYKRDKERVIKCR